MSLVVTVGTELPIVLRSGRVIDDGVEEVNMNGSVARRVVRPVNDN